MTFVIHIDELERVALFVVVDTKLVYDPFEQEDRDGHRMKRHKQQHNPNQVVVGLFKNERFHLDRKERKLQQLRDVYT